MAELQRLQFSIGPVQGFVAQSRRTRDLWASSFLLSHLAGVAIEAVKDQGGHIVLPAWDKADRQEWSASDFGTVPNRFVADVADGRVAAEVARAALLQEWKRVADAVWQKFVQGVAGDGETRNIWNRQVDHFWEISWVVGTTQNSEHLLASRKNWRTTPATVEPGDHCTMMGDRQELSGHIRSLDRSKQNDFWTRLRAQVGVGKLDLGDDERLCAISLIKRLFPKVAQEAIGRPLKHTNWPSTAYVAAIPWLKEVASNDESQSLAKAYGAKIRELARDSLGERMTRIPSLQSHKENTGHFLSLDGNFFQTHALANRKTTPFQEELSDQADATQRRVLADQLQDICRVTKRNPSAFYALLLMDGDSMGALLGAARQSSGGSGEQQATRALSRFSRAVPVIVSKHDGITIYAGGDDVLVMLPLAEALTCAIELTDEYRRSFETECGNVIAKSATLSGAIVYAHYHTPLREVLATGHFLLDDVAKDTTGRDSLAIAVFKGSGITALWSAPWSHIRPKAGENIIDDLVGGLRQKDSNGRGEFSSGFLYNIRDRFAALTDSALTRPGEFGQLATELQKSDLLERVLVADYLRGLSHSKGDDATDKARDEATKSVQSLLKISQRVTRQLTGSDPPEFKIVSEPHSLGMDGALLVRFLASGGKEDTE